MDNADKIVSAGANDSNVVSADSKDEMVSTDVVEKDDVVSIGSKSGNSSSFDFSSLFNGTSISFGNGTSFNLSSLFNGTTISFGNGTSFNTSSLLNANFTFGNGTSFNVSSLIGSNGTSFDIGSILDIFGGKTVTDSINATDLSKVYTTNTKYSVKVMHGNETLTSGAVSFTIDNKEYVGSWKDGSVYVNLKNLKPGDHFIITEYDENKVLKNTKVAIKVNGKTYSAKTNSKGQATIKITKLTKVGKFNATVKSAATACYKSVTKTVTITVKK